MIQPIGVRATIVAPESPITTTWSYTINGGGSTMFGIGASAIFTTPASIQNTDANGAAGVDVAVLTATDQHTMVSSSVTVLIGQGPANINHTNPLGQITDEQSIPEDRPKDRVNPGGVTDTTVPVGNPMTDEENDPGEGSGACVPLQPVVAEFSGGEGCSCAPPMSLSFFDGSGTFTLSGGGGPSNVATPGGGAAAGLIQPGAMICAAENSVLASQAWTRPYGVIQVKSGCGALVTRGKPVELCTWFSNVPDGLVAAERYAGKKTMFGWMARLIQDTTGNVAIYWGDRTVEAWQTTDGGATFTAPKGNFGTLTKQGDGSFTRATKDTTYYDFDSAGRLQTIKDRSADGNVVYYNYNGSNQPIRITGPGLGYKPYFTYDANNRINAMNLEGASPWPERTTYFDYDASGRMNKMIWPENCISYFDYDGNDNLSQETNADNFITYFNYGAQAVPRIREINLPLTAALYFTYDDTVPRHTRAQAGGTTKQFDYQWAGLGEKILIGSEASYFSFDANAKPTMAQGTDGNRTYYEWDASGQMTVTREPQDSLQYFTYGGSGRITSWKNPAGRMTYWNYDATGFQKNWIDRKGNVTYFERDSFGKIASVKDRNANVTYFTHNAQGLVTSRKAADLTVRYFDWNPGAEVELVIDELANVTYFHHDKRGRITRWKDNLGQITDYGFDNRSNLTVMIDKRANAWYWEYDGLSRRTVARTALLNTSYFSYNRANLRTSVVDPRANPTYFYYTAEKRLLAQETALKELTYFTYTAAGQMESIRNPRGYAQYWTYDVFHRVSTVKDAVGNVATNLYDVDGDMSAVTDARGNTTYLYYDEMDRTFARRNPLSEVSYFYYDAEGNQTCAEDALRRRTYFYFDSMERRFAVEDAQKNLTYYTFEQRGPVSSAKNARGYVGYLYYDALERQFAAKDARGGVTYMQYDANSNRVASRDARGNTSYFDFDKDNRNISATTPLNETTYLAYDAAANRTNVKDARGNLSYFYFDTLNRLSCSEDAKQARSYFTFDSAGNASSEMDPLGRVTYHYYDGNSRRFSTQDALAGFRYFTFDAASNNDSVKNPRGFVTYMYYDGLNRLFSQQSPVAGFTYFAFDAVGNRTSVKDPVARMNYFYFDSLNRQYASEDGLRNRTYFEFDVMGNTMSIKNPRRATVTPAEVGIQYFTYDELNRRNSAKDEVASVWYYDYDSASNLQVQTNPRAALTYWACDALNRKQSQKDPLARSWYWTYDATGNVNSVKNGKAQTTYYHYDSVNLLTRVDYPGSFLPDYFVYDAGRQRTAMADKTGGTYWLYDNLGRTTFRLNPWFGSIGAAVTKQRLYYQYDPNGNRVTLKDQDSVTIYYDWDSADRTKEIRSSTYGGWISYYEYNKSDQMVYEKRQNTTVTYHGYDAAGRVSQIQHRTDALTEIEKQDYTRDEAGNPVRIAVSQANGLQMYFNYDSANRITKEAWLVALGSTPHLYGFLYTYDAAGNRATKTDALSAASQYWEYDAADQLQKQRDGGAVGVYFEFDANGNLAVEHDTNASAGRTYYDYEPRNLLSRVDFPGATKTNYFYYNAVGERIRKDDNSTQNVYTWDGIDVLQEKAVSNGALQVRNIKGVTPIAGIGAYVMHATTIAATPKRFPLKNQVGSTVKLTNATGGVLGTLRYDAWGQPFEASGTVQNYQFNGKELDPDFVAFNSNNRRYHYPARTYVPFRAAFALVDPLCRDRVTYKSDAEGLPLASYIFVRNAPTLAVDPLGLNITDEECLASAKRLIKEMTKEFNWGPGGCVPDVTCKWCCQDHAGMAGVTDLTKITMCIDHIPSGSTPDEIDQYVRHEFAHAADHCKGFNRYPSATITDWGLKEMADCEEKACREIRAYSFARQCDTNGVLLPGNADRKACVIASAMISMGTLCAPLTARIVANVYDRCVVPEGATALPKFPKLG
ncbi:MAG: hypothetical protein K8T20_19050 [Planctomycetes bacterium]|nr:hypothetical protein [Planctomycetota bacterium]